MVFFKRHMILLVTLLLFLIRQFATIGMDYNANDEGIIYSALTHFFNGGALYTDVWWGYGPLMPWLYLPGLKALGLTLFNVRMLSILILAAGVWGAYALSRRYMPPLWSAATALLCHCMVFQPLYNYGHAIIPAAVAWGLYGLVRFQDSRNNRWIFFSGISAVLVFLHKPVPVGMMLLAAWLTALLLYTAAFRNHRLGFFTLRWFLTVAVLSILCFGVIFLSIPYEKLQSTLLFFRSDEGFAFSFQPWPNPVIPVVQITHATTVMEFYTAVKELYYSVFYYLPILMLFAVAAYLWKYPHTQNSLALFTSAWIAPALFFQYYLYGGRIGHGNMGFLILPAVFLLMYFFHEIYSFWIRSLRSRTGRWIATGALWGLMAGLYVFPSMYVFNTALYSTRFNAGTMAHIKVSGNIHKVYTDVIHFVHSSTPRDATLLCLQEDAQQYNFLLDRTNVDIFHLFDWYNIANTSEQKTETVLLPAIRDQLPDIIIDGRCTQHNPAINRLLESHYKLAFETGTIHDCASAAEFLPYYAWPGNRVYLRSSTKHLLIQ